MEDALPASGHGSPLESPSPRGHAVSGPAATPNPDPSADGGGVTDDRAAFGWMLAVAGLLAAAVAVAFAAFGR